MRILVIGSGAREHALLRALRRDPVVDELHVAPGNAGTAALATAHRIDVSDNVGLVALAVEMEADLVVVGPEVPLVAGIVDDLAAAGVPAFGPSAAAARIEGSKVFAKDVMARAGVPTGRCLSLGADASDHDIRAGLSLFEAPYVVKDDGLAAGKGVVVTGDVVEAATHARAVADAGHPVLIEEFLAGPEVSLFAICDGTSALALLPAQDFKRVGNNDAGPNTGGMGAYAPLDWAPADLVPTVTDRILHPVLAEMSRRGAPFRGLLYAGLVLTASGPQVIEFNCRFGDPETQVVLELLDTPLAGVLAAAATGTVAGVQLSWRKGSAVTVVIAAENYPGTPVTGDRIAGLPEPTADTVVLHAGTRTTDDGDVVSAGGRVLSATATGPDLAAARARAYSLIEPISLRGKHFRTDIAERAERGEIVVPN